MIDYTGLDRALSELEVAHLAMKRAFSLLRMSQYDNPYRPLVRVMCKLKLIKEWTIF